MEPKDSKRRKNIHNQSNSLSGINKHIDNPISIHKLINRNKMPRTIKTNFPSNTNSKNLDEKIVINSKNKINSNTKIINNIKQNDDGKKTKNCLTSKISEKKFPKLGDKFKKPKTPIKSTNFEKQKSKKITEKNSKKNPFFKENKIEISEKPKKRKSENMLIKPKNKNNNDIKNDENNQKLPLNEQKIVDFKTQKLLELLFTLSPIDIDKCDDLISYNMNKILELQQKMSEISKMAQYEILKVSCDDSKKNNQMKHKQEMQIINIESNMRKDTYILFFNFISDILNQINSLTNNLGKKETGDNNLVKESSDNRILNNSSLISNSSFLVSNIEDEFCEKLIGITKSFISDFDIDLSEINLLNLNKINKQKQERGEYEYNLNDDENKITDFDTENGIKDKEKDKETNVQTKQIFEKINVEPKVERKVLHHYSNSLRVNSNFEKLEAKNKIDEKKNDNNQDKMKNFQKCIIF